MNRGMTIIETVTATAVLVFGLVGVASLLSYGVRANLDNRQRTTAILLIQQKLEEFRSKSWDDPALAPGANEEIVGPLHGQSYVLSWELTGSNLRTVSVIVYRERPGGVRIELARATTTIAASF
jgi:Tfp pilus assembly protein PilV